MRNLFLIGFLGACGGSEEHSWNDSGAEIGWDWMCEHPDSPYVGRLTAVMIDDEPWELVEMVVIDDDDLFVVPMQEIYVSDELYGWKVETNLYDLDCLDDNLSVFAAYSGGEG